jgi:hypothetical protein
MTSWQYRCTALLVPVVGLLVLYCAAAVLLEWGRHTAFGPGLVGAATPLLVLEAWVFARDHWRARLLHSLAFAAPACLLAVFLSASPYWCCHCDQSPGARALRNVEFVGDLLYFSALAALPAYALLVVLPRRSASPRESMAYMLATLSSLLATLLAVAPFFAMLYALKLVML